MHEIPNRCRRNTKSQPDLGLTRGAGKVWLFPSLRILGRAVRMLDHALRMRTALLACACVVFTEPTLGLWQPSAASASYWITQLYDLCNNLSGLLSRVMIMKLRLRFIEWNCSFFVRSLYVSCDFVSKTTKMFERLTCVRALYTSYTKYLVVMFLNFIIHREEKFYEIKLPLHMVVILLIGIRITILDSFLSLLILHIYSEPMKTSLKVKKAA